MNGTSKIRQRTIHAVSLSESSKKEETTFPDDLPTLLSNLRQLLLKKSENEDEIDPTISQYIQSITTKIAELSNLPEPTQILDTSHSTLKTYITDLLPITKCLHILSDESFQLIFLSLIYIENTLDLPSLCGNDPHYARTVCYRSFELLSSPVIIDFLNEKYPKELFSHVSCILHIIIDRIRVTLEYIVFKKDDFKDQIPILNLLMKYTDNNIQNLEEINMLNTIQAVFNFLWTFADDTILVPSLIESNCHTFILKWISMKDLSLDFQHSCMHILHNLARHELGVEALNGANCINIMKELKQRILDPNKNNNDVRYKELRLLYSMSLSLLTEPKENREDLDNLRPVLNQLMQLIVDAGQSLNYKYGGFHVSEPIVVLTKLCVHDEILKYVLMESTVNNMQATSKVDLFCHLLMKFRGALASDDELDQLTLTALFNILWSISFHDEYLEELKTNAKFLITVKSLANDDGEAWVDQYVPQHMSSISKAANGILWNLDENNPARTARVTVPVTNESKMNDTVTNNRIRVMVSYSHADTEFCQPFVNVLQKDNRLDVWVDFAYCHTEDLWEEIAEAIEKSDIILFLMSKDYQDSKSCRQEVMYAKDSLKKRFIPIYVKKEFVPTGWLGVRIVGPQYIRFGKKSFDDTIKELIKLIIEDKKPQGQQSDQKKETKPPPSVIEVKPTENTNNQTKPLENIDTNSNVKLPDKPVERWIKKDISQWFDSNQIQQDLVDLYDFQDGAELLLYGQCLRPDWQIEYNDMRERYQQKYDTQLYRDQFVRFVAAVNRLQPSESHSNSKLCVIS